MDGVVPAPLAPPGAAAGPGAQHEGSGSSRLPEPRGSATEWTTCAPTGCGRRALSLRAGEEWAQRTRFLWRRPRALRGTGRLRAEARPFCWVQPDCPVSLVLTSPAHNVESNFPSSCFLLLSPLLGQIWDALPHALQWPPPPDPRQVGEQECQGSWGWGRGGSHRKLSAVSMRWGPRGGRGATRGRFTTRSGIPVTFRAGCMWKSFLLNLRETRGASGTPC